jgi:serine/threonine protein kinase
MFNCSKGSDLPEREPNDRNKRRKVSRKAYNSAFKALDEIHEKGVIHGDIRGTNVVIEGDKAKLIDFGMSGQWVQVKWVSGRRAVRSLSCDTHLVMLRLRNRLHHLNE